MASCCLVLILFFRSERGAQRRFFQRENAKLTLNFVYDLGRKRLESIWCLNTTFWAQFGALEGYFGTISSICSQGFSGAKITSQGPISHTSARARALFNQVAGGTGGHSPPIPQATTHPPKYRTGQLLLILE